MKKLLFMLGGTVLLSGCVATIAPAEEGIRTSYLVPLVEPQTVYVQYARAHHLPRPIVRPNPRPHPQPILRTSPKPAPRPHPQHKPQPNVKPNPQMHSKPGSRPNQPQPNARPNPQMQSNSRPNARQGSGHSQSSGPRTSGRTSQHTHR